MTPRNGELAPGTYHAAAVLRAGLRQFGHASARTLRGTATTERYEVSRCSRSTTPATRASGARPCRTSPARWALPSSSVTQLVRRVEDTGLLRREVSTTDARVRYLRLTSRGERKLAQAVAELSEERERLAQFLARA